MKTDKTFVEHLEELRRRILFSGAGVLTVSAFSFIFHKSLLKVISLPVNEKLVFIAPPEPFIVSLKIALLAGLVISSPFTLYHMWRFVGCALYRREKRFLMRYVPFATLLFLLGVMFGYLVVLPAGLRFLIGFGGDVLEPMISVGKYVSFVFLIVLVFGLAFQVPLIMKLTVYSGVVTRQKLRESRRYAIVAIFIVAAVLTPPDVFTQLALAVPLIFLYEVGLLFSGRRAGNGKGEAG